MELGNFIVKLTSQFDGAGLDKMKAGFSNMASVGLAGATAVAGAFVKMVDSTVKQGEELDKLRKITGVSTVELSKIKYAAEQEHTSIESVTLGFKKLSNTMDAAVNGNKEAISGFDEIGVSIQNTDGSMRNQVEVLKDVATSFSGMTDETEKTAIAQKLFGRTGMDLIPFLNMGRAGIDALGSEAEKLGVVMGDKTASDLETFGDNIGMLKSAFNGVVISVVTEFLPMLTDIVNNFKAMILEGDNWKRGITTVVTIAINGFKLVYTVLEGVGKLIADVGFLLISVFTLNINGVKVAMAGLWEDYKGGFTAVIEASILGWGQIQAAANGTLSNIKAGAESIPPVPSDSNVIKSVNNLNSIGMAWKNTTAKMIKEGINWTEIVTSAVSVLEGSIKNLFLTLVTTAKEGENKWLVFYDSLKAAFLDLVATIVAKMGVLAILNLLSGGSVGTIGGLLKGAVKGFSTGGIVRSPQLAMIGEAGPEAVVPLNRLSSISGGPVTVNINGAVDRDNIDEIAGKLERAVRNGQADGLSKALNTRGNRLSGEA